MGKNVAVFVDVANIFYAAKAAGVDIDYVTLLKSAVAGRDFVRAYAYTGLDPENENQRNFHAFLARNGYRVVSKDIRKYGDGKVKANLDIELVVDMLKTARNLDVAIVVSGDGDFAPAIRAVQEMGVRVEVISFKGNTSSDLIDVADIFTDITQLAKVERGTRSGRRVAEAEEEDLSMTAVPEKQTEGPSRGRGRGRGRARAAEAEPVEAPARGGRERRPAGAAPREAPAAVAGAGLVALPGEKLSKATAGQVPGEEEPELAEQEPEEGVSPGEGQLEEGGRRRRRRRGGRGRGRGRGREGEVLEGLPEGPGEAVGAAVEEEEEVAYEQPRVPRSTPFGSFWDSQIGMPKAPAAGLAPLSPEEFEEEPEIPEYLIAEQRRGRGAQGGQAGRGGRGGRGARGGYAAAVERERYGRGGGGGINRYPDVSGRTAQGGRAGGPRREERPAERAPRPVTGRGGEPWSEVPPEVEEMLRAQLAQRPRPAPSPTRAEPAAAAGEGAPRARRGGERRGAGRPAAEASAGAELPATIEVDATAEAGQAGVAAAAAAETAAPRPRRATRGRATAATAPAVESEPATPAPRRRAARATSTVGGDGGAAASEPAPEDATAAVAKTPAPRRRVARSKAAAPAGGSAPASATDGAPEAGTEPPKRRANRTRAKKEVAGA